MATGQVLTIEPGCYMLTPSLTELSKFFVVDRINEYRGLRGVRIEHEVIITESCMKLMSIIPRTVEEIEGWMAGNSRKVKK